MPLYSDEEIIELANQMKNGQLTYDELIAHINGNEELTPIKKRTVQRYFNDRLFHLDKNLYFELKDIIEKNVQLGREKGGKTSKRKPRWSEEEAIEICNNFIVSGLSVRKFAESVEKSKSTIYEIIKFVSNLPFEKVNYLPQEIENQLALNKQFNREEFINRRGK